MSSDVVIRAEKLSKLYQIGEGAGSRSRYKSLRDVLSNPFRRKSKPRETIWALKDVSFEIKQGEVVGIIGRNGAGKSTLLKILSRITEPTEGYADITGRVGSLLEVGTGFHPELTGRENIYLNGAILGMKRAEIAGKFDEIVAFAEVEKFIDTPVKHYSSGMHVRLAFAVAAHLEPEILLVDEVLAVGDAEFQKKCLGKMGDVAREGRTILFVSHNMAAIGRLCSHAMLIDKGTLRQTGGSAEVIHDYLVSHASQSHFIELQDRPARQGTGAARFVRAELRDAAQTGQSEFSVGDTIAVVFTIAVADSYRGKKLKLAVELRSSEGIRLCNMVDVDSGFQIEHASPRESLTVELSDIRLYPDSYYVSLWAGSVTSLETFDYVEDCLRFDIRDGGKLTTRTLPRSDGLLFLTPRWRRESADNCVSTPGRHT